MNLFLFALMIANVISALVFSDISKQYSKHRQAQALYGTGANESRFEERTRKAQRRQVLSMVTQIVLFMAGSVFGAFAPGSPFLGLTTMIVATAALFASVAAAVHYSKRD